MAQQFIEDLCVTVPELRGAEVMFLWDPQIPCTMMAYANNRDNQPSNPAFHLALLEQRVKVLRSAADNMMTLIHTLNQRAEELNTHLTALHAAKKSLEDANDANKPASETSNDAHV